MRERIAHAAPMLFPFPWARYFEFAYITAVCAQLRTCTLTRALTYHGCTRAFRVSRTRASVTPMHPSFVIYRTRYRSLIAYCNTRSYP